VGAEKTLYISVFFALLCLPVSFADVWDSNPVILWTYQYFPIMEDGRNGDPDFQRTEDALHDIGATGMFLGLGRKSQYDGFLYFLEQSKNTDIKIWIAMSHTCWEEPEPYQDDCTNWIRHLAELSLTYPNLEAVVFDDLHPDMYPNEVTPQFIQGLIEEKNRINPQFKFIPTLYYDAGDELQFFQSGNRFEGSFKDGASLWYWASFGGSGAISQSQLDNYISQANEVVPPERFMTGVYTLKEGEYAETGNPDDLFYPYSELKGMIESAKSGSNGVGLFDPPLHLYDLNYYFSSTMFQQQANDDPAYDYMLSNSNKGTFISWYQAITAKVPVAKGSRIDVQFDARDTAGSTETSYLFKKIVANGKDILAVDACADGSARTPYSASFVAETTTAEIKIMLYSKNSNWIGASMYIDNPKILVNGVDAKAVWRFESNMTRFSENIATYKAIKDALRSSSCTSLWDCSPYTCGACSDGKIQCTRQCTDQKGCSASYTDTLTTSCLAIGTWNLDEGKGATAADSAGGNDGMVAGASWTSDSAQGSALRFDGIDDYVLVSDSDSLNPDYVTFSLWFKADSLIDNSGLIAKGSGSGRQYWAWIYEGNLSLEIDEGSHHNYVYPLSVGRWYHLAVAYDGNTVTTYVNGVKVNSYSQQTGPIISDASPLYFGMLPDFAHFAGTIDEVKLYDRALTASEIAQLYGNQASRCGALDTDKDNRISTVELMSSLKGWRAGNIAFNDIYYAINAWKNGC